MKLLNLNELDYFLNKELCKNIELYRKNDISMLKCIKKLAKESISKKYPKTKIKIKMKKEDINDPYIPKMQILMDFASVANKNSFKEIEKDVGLQNII